MHRLQPQHWGMWTLLELDEDTLYILLGLSTHNFQDIHTLHMYTTHTNQKDVLV